MTKRFRIGDWIQPIAPIINEINYGYNRRLIIDVSDDGEEFTTTCEAFGPETIWNIYNAEFAGRIVFDA